ncbi:ATP-binding protein [Nocardia sp. NRRL S-836]|uniref:ATP-binding protein n=1 Tax=Nocardia sp. NRRL S-836 TaxID=1519492 RepID=UPI000B000198|nr:ATP-binding protein [Nocardia sp. NRRL S-836]
MTIAEVETALAAPRRDVGALLLAAPEDQWYDRKNVLLEPRDLAPAIVAFANAEGGTIAIGLHNGKVQGVDAHRRKMNDFRQVPIDFTVPPVRVQFLEIECVNSEGESDHLLVVQVEPSEVVHETQKGDCYLRIGDESRKLNFNQRQELHFDKGQSQYDGFEAEGVTISDLDAKLLTHYKRRTGASDTAQKLLAARSLMTRKGKINNAGYLLFGKHPQDVHPQAYIRVIRYLSTERGTGSSLSLEDGADIRFEGPIPYAIQGASGAIDELIPKRRSLGESGTFESHPIVPRNAWLEGLVNAAVHRSYSLAGDHIRVEIFPNRIEIESPGRFPGLANPQRPLEISRFARNPRIARVCADLRIGQELGEGIKRIFAEMRRVGLTDPVYKQSAGSVRLILVDMQRLDPRIAAKLPRGSQQVLDVLRASANPLGTGDIAEALGLSRPATKIRLKALEDLRLIRWNGKSAKDPRAVWSLPEDDQFLER